MINNWLLAIFSFRKTITTVIVVGLLLTYFELESFTTYVVAVFVSLVHPFYERLERISKNIHEERDEVDIEVRSYLENRVIVYAKKMVTAIIILVILLAIIDIV